MASFGGAYGADYTDPYVIPDLVKQFVVYFYRHIRERNIVETQAMYEVSFVKLSERYFKTVPWPPVEMIADLADNDHVFCLLYKEIYYRHLYAKCNPDLRQRCESWDNYCDLFGVILHGSVNMQLPTLWLWDMIDEFVYQFQSFCQYRGKQRTPDEIELLKQCDKVWNVLDVLNVLQALVDKSGIVDELLQDSGARLYASEGYSERTSNVLRMLGYFSLPGLSRVHSIIGDYQSGLKAIYPIGLFGRSPLFTSKITGCHITLYYYAGFAYLMLRRYTDAARCFNIILMHIHRVKQFMVRSGAAYDLMLKKNEQMFSLLAIVAALCPAAQKLLDENTGQQLQQRHSDAISRMQGGDEGTFKDLFAYGCPKFITAQPPSYDQAGPTNHFQLAYKTQLDIFVREVASQKMLPKLKKYLILYSSIALPKLAALMETDVLALRTTLLCLKSKSYTLKHDGSLDATAGNFALASDIEFCIDVDANTGEESVMVADMVHMRHHADFLTSHIGKLEQIIRDLEAPTLAAPPRAVAPQAAY